MSKTSNKQKLDQLKLWLDGRKTTTKRTPTGNRTKSRSDYYKKQGFNG